MTISRLYVLSLSFLIISVGCKGNQPSVVNESRVVANGQVESLISENASEFFGILQDFYLRRASEFDFSSAGPFEIRFFEKFGVSRSAPSSKIVVKQISSEFFGYLGFETCGLKLFGVGQDVKAACPSVKNLSQRDLQDFFQIVKAEYYKYISLVSSKSLTDREKSLYAKIQSTTPSSIDRGELLVNAGDLFLWLETGRL
jgi:hypothetical protein